VDRLIIASASSRTANHPLKGAWSSHLNRLNFGGHKPYHWNGLSYSFKFCKQVGFVKSQHKNDKSPLKGAWSGSRNPL